MMFTVSSKTISNFVTFPLYNLHEFKMDQMFFLNCQILSNPVEKIWKKKFANKGIEGEEEISVNYTKTQSK